MRPILKKYFPLILLFIVYSFSCYSIYFTAVSAEFEPNATNKTHTLQED
jgi:hypothetical protein